MAAIKDHACPATISWVEVNSKSEDSKERIDWVGAAYLFLDTVFVSFGLIMLGAAIAGYVILK